MEKRWKTMQSRVTTNRNKQNAFFKTKQLMSFFCNTEKCISFDSFCKISSFRYFQQAVVFLPCKQFWHWFLVPAGTQTLTALVSKNSRALLLPASSLQYVPCSSFRAISLSILRRYQTKATSRTMRTINTIIDAPPITAAMLYAFSKFCKAAIAGQPSGSILQWEERELNVFHVN